MTREHKIQQTALQCAKYLDNMLRRIGNHQQKNVPTKHLTDYFSEGGYLPHIEDSISVKDVVFGRGTSDSYEVPNETILIGRGDDGYFGYTKSHTKEVIALALTYRFLDMKLPYRAIGMSKKSCHNGMYASDIWGIIDNHKHLEHIFSSCLDIKYNYEQYLENPFYEMFFCGKNLGEFKDEMGYCSTEEEYICELFLTELEYKFKSFTIFSTVDDVFSMDKVNYSFILDS